MGHCKTCSIQTDNPNFCSRSCAAKHNNRGLNRHNTIKPPCLSCGKTVNLARSIFCSNKCQHAYQDDQKKKLIFDDEIVNWRQIKRVLLEEFPCCSKCGIDEWNGLPISLECDHIDGDITNNRLSNARLLCPNCHSQTLTYKAKNTHNPKGKQKRRERYEKNLKDGTPDRI